MARAAQRPPEGEWYLWALVGGRGSGKTRAGVEWLAEELRGDRRGDESAVLAPTFGDARDTCVEGLSGLLGALERRGVAVAAWNRSIGELRLASGAVVRIDGADDGALRLQGHNFRRALCDELGLWRQGTGERAWDESLLPAVRLGEPQIVVTTTPKPTPLMRRLLQDSSAVVTRMTTFENEPNLAPAFIEQMRARYAGTRLGRQELLGELVEDVEGALWRRGWLDRDRVSEVPYPGLGRTYCALDPADGTAEGDEQAIAVAGLGSDHDLYVVHSEGMRATPLEWLRRAIELACRWQATIVYEKNFSGQFGVTLLEQAMREAGVRVPYREVTASQGKRTRAEPVAALYEQGRVHHVGRFSELEEQLATWTGAPAERSPDRLDALVWALWEFTGYSFGAEEEGPVAVPWNDDPRVIDGAARYQPAPGEPPWPWEAPGRAGRVGGFG
jgi:predicted phage terminase large subunit-like protein